MNSPPALLLKASDIRRAAMNLLARREHSTGELSRKLSARVDDLQILDNVLNQLENDGLLSDLRFTEAYVRYRSNKGFGPIKISAELREKGVGENLIQDFIDHTSAKWFELTRLVRQKKFDHQLPNSLPEKAKQIRFLSQRGFSQEQISAAVDHDEK